ncbi:MAG: hypothetical protein ACK6B2_10685 [Planctomycetota bacterium]|jgi:hypothetical protein
MNEIISAIEQHLQRRLKVSQLDYYQVLGLEPFCADKTKIETALESASQMVRKSEQSNKGNKDATASLVLVNKLLRQAQAILLDASKKTAYDSQLAKLFESQKKQKALGDSSPATTTTSIGILSTATSKTSASKTVPSPVSNASQLLPPGDPMQPYLVPSSNQTTASGALSTAMHFSVDKRRAELAELFPSLMLKSLQTEPTQDQTPAWLIAADRKGVKSKSEVPTESPTANSTQPPASKPVDLVDQLRKRRKRRNLLAVGSMILAALGFLGIASYRFISNRMQIAQQEKKSPRENSPINPQEGNPAAQGSATKPPPELAIRSNKPRNGRPGSDTPLPQLPGVNRDPAADQAMPQANMAEPELMPKPVENKPAENKPEEMKPEETKPEPAPAPMPAGDSPEWKSSMTQAKELLVKGDLKKFEPMMASLLDKAVTKEGKDQTLRLDQAGQLYRIYVDSFEEAKRKAKGASSLKVGAAEVSIVEATAEKLVVRAQGQNKTYMWDKLPLGIAAALSDLGLSESEPVDVAARAIYFSVTPYYQEEARANNLISKRIDGWFERSAGKGSVRADLKQFLTDKYE